MSLSEGFALVPRVGLLPCFHMQAPRHPRPQVSSSGFASVALLASCHCATGGHAYFGGESWP